MHNELDGKVALVTGAGRGFGRTISELLAARGVSVLVADIDEAQVQEVSDQIVASGGRAKACRVDVRDRESVHQMVEASRELGVLELAVNNAGIAGPARPIAEYPVDDWTRIIETNLTGVFHCLQAELSVMADAGRGSIVNVASVLGLVGRPNAGAYVAAKHAVVGLTKTAALEYGEQGVRVNAVAPGYVLTDLNRERLTKREQSGISAATALGRLGRTDEIADMVVFLLSEAASYVTGSCLVADGGYSAH